MIPLSRTKQSEENDDNQWSLDIESILDKIRLNAAVYSEYHKEEYYKNKGYLKYFKIPTIIFSALSSVFSVGLQPYVSQSLVSVITCLIGLFVGILNSLELFLAIQTTMENELNHSREFYLLSVDIFKTLLLMRSHRLNKGPVYLDEKYSMYCKLVESSVLTNRIIGDKMLTSNEMISYEVAGIKKTAALMKRSNSPLSRGFFKEKGQDIANNVVDAATSVVGAAGNVVGNTFQAVGTASSVVGSTFNAVGTALTGSPVDPNSPSFLYENQIESNNESNNEYKADGPGTGFRLNPSAASFQPNNTSAAATGFQLNPSAASFTPSFLPRATLSQWCVVEMSAFP